MSGLLVKSTAFMKDNLQAFNEAGISVPVILGGAALTPRFVQKDCREVYNGQVIYGRDALTTCASWTRWWRPKKAMNGVTPKAFSDHPEGLGLNGDAHSESAGSDDSGPSPPSRSLHCQ